MPGPDLPARQLSVAPPRGGFFVLGWLGATLVGLVEVVRVALGPLAPGPGAIAFLAVLALVFPGGIGTLVGLAAVEPLRRKGRSWALLGGAAIGAVTAFGLAVADGPVGPLTLGNVGRLAALPGIDETHPNVLLVVLDSARADRFGAWPIDTSATDRVGAEGARFDLAYASIPACGPSLANLLSGRAPWEEGVLRDGDPLVSSPTLAEALAAEGYRTAAFVSSDRLRAGLGFERGFQLYDDDFRWVTGLGHTAAGRLVARLGARDHDRRGDDTAGLAVDWLSEVGQERPFFLLVHLDDAHAPYSPPSPWDERYWDGGPRDPSDPAWQASQYDGEVAFADTQVERLLDGLDDRGLAADTLVVVVGDHGEGLGEHGEHGHGEHVFDQDLRVPLVMRLPGRIPAATVVRSPVELGDIAPTVLAWVGLPAIETHTGANLRDAIESGRPTRATARAITPERPRSAAIRGSEDFAIVSETDGLVDYEVDGRPFAPSDPEQVRARDLRVAQARALFEAAAH